MWFKHVGITVVKGQKFKVVSDTPQVFQTDGEVLKDIKEFEINIE